MMSWRIIMMKTIQLKQIVIVSNAHFICEIFVSIFSKFSKCEKCILYIAFNWFTHNRVANDRIISYNWRQWTIICETQIEQIFTDASLDMFNIWVSNERHNTLKTDVMLQSFTKLLLYIKMNRYCTHTKRILKSHLRPLLNMFYHGRLIIHQSV